MIDVHKNEKINSIISGSSICVVPNGHMPRLTGNSDSRSCLCSHAMEVTSPLRASSLPAHFQNNVTSIKSITLLSKRSLSSCSSQSDSLVVDVEDSGRLMSSQKRNRVVASLLSPYRRKRGLVVTDITATEWCGKKMEYTLLCGKPEKTKAMKAGRSRHEALEEEVIKKVKVCVDSAGDVWALKVGFVEGIWMVGVIDEIRMPEGQNDAYPMLVDTKTRVQASLPLEPQWRNGSLVADDSPSASSLSSSVNPNHIYICTSQRKYC
ncbi:hypothetical protein H5410_012975, partial [Solanum commersonii]